MKADTLRNERLRIVHIVLDCVAKATVADQPHYQPYLRRVTDAHHDDCPSAILLEGSLMRYMRPQQVIEMNRGSNPQIRRSIETYLRAILDRGADAVDAHTFEVVIPKELKNVLLDAMLIMAAELNSYTLGLTDGLLKRLTPQKDTLAQKARLN